VQLRNHDALPRRKVHLTRTLNRGDDGKVVGAGTFRWSGDLSTETGPPSGLGTGLSCRTGIFSGRAAECFSRTAELLDYVRSPGKLWRTLRRGLHGAAEELVCRCGRTRG